MFRIVNVLISALVALVVVIAVIAFEGKGAVLVFGHVVNIDPVREWLFGPAGLLWPSNSSGTGIVYEILRYAVMGIYYFFGFGLIAKFWADERPGLAMALAAVMALLNTVSVCGFPT